MVYIDRVDISGYHWASVADHLVLDPAGAIGLQGYVAGHTYFKDALDKLGSASTSGGFSSTNPRPNHTSAATCPPASASS